MELLTYNPIHLGELAAKKLEIKQCDPSNQLNKPRAQKEPTQQISREKQISGWVYIRHCMAYVLFLFLK